jgi:hypothetical protein
VSSVAGLLQIQGAAQVLVRDVVQVPQDLTDRFPRQLPQLLFPGFDDLPVIDDVKLDQDLAEMAGLTQGIIRLILVYVPAAVF